VESGCHPIDDQRRLVSCQTGAATGIATDIATDTTTVRDPGALEPIEALSGPQQSSRSEGDNGDIGWSLGGALARWLE